MKIKLTDNVYNNIKGLICLTFPLLSSLMFLSSYIWILPNTKLIMGIFSTITLFLGIVLFASIKQHKISGAAYDGQLVITEPEDGLTRFTLELNGDPEDLAQKESVTFEIIPSL